MYFHSFSAEIRLWKIKPQGLLQDKLRLAKFSLSPQMWCIKKVVQVRFLTSDFWPHFNTIKLQATLLFWLCVNSRGASPLAVSNWTCSTDHSVIGSFGCRLYWESWRPLSFILCKYCTSTLALDSGSWPWPRPVAADPGHGDHVEDIQGHSLDHWETGRSGVIVVDSEVSPYNSGGVSQKLPNQQGQGYVGYTCQRNCGRSASYPRCVSKQQKWWKN